MSDEATPEIISAGEKGGENQPSSQRTNYPNAKPQPKQEAQPAAEQPTAGEKETPSWQSVVPEKFRRDTPEATLEALSKSYTELEKMKSGAKPEAKTENLEIPDKTEEPTKPAAEDGLSKTDQAKIWSVVEQELGSQGLTEETVKQLQETYNVPPGLLAQLNGLVSETRAARTEQAARLVGGEENLSDLLQWAGANLSAEEKADLNAQLNNSRSWKTTLLGLQALYSQSTSKPTAKPSGDLIEPTGASTGGLRPFQSMNEMVEYQRKHAEAYRNPKHPDHSKVRSEFEKRLTMSHKSGTLK